MAKIVNLNRFRKDRARAERRRQADGNAARFGRSKARKGQEAAEAASEARRLDGHAIDRGDPEGGTPPGREHEDGDGPDGGADRT